MLKVIIYNKDYEEVKIFHFVKSVCNNCLGLVLDTDDFGDIELIYKFDYFYFRVVKE